MQFCMSLSMVASGGDCLLDLADGTPIYTRMNRWAKNGVLDRVFEHLQREQIVRVKLEAVSMDSTPEFIRRCSNGQVRDPDGTAGLATKTNSLMRRKTDQPNKTGHRKQVYPAVPQADGPPRFIWLPQMLERP